MLAGMSALVCATLLLFRSCASTVGLLAPMFDGTMKVVPNDPVSSALASVTAVPASDALFLSTTSTTLPGSNPKPETATLVPGRTRPGLSRIVGCPADGMDWPLTLMVLVLGALTELLRAGAVVVVEGAWLSAGAGAPRSAALFGSLTTETSSRRSGPATTSPIAITTNVLQLSHDLFMFIRRSGPQRLRGTCKARFHASWGDRGHRLTLEVRPAPANAGASRATGSESVWQRPRYQP